MFSIQRKPSVQFGIEHWVILFFFLLQFIQVHRHGDRTPIYDYPNDPHKNHWGGSKGVLTNKGVDQLCNVGFTIKSRYSALLPEGGKYTPRNTRVITSPIERCEKSVGALLKCMTSIRKPDGNTEFKKQPVNFTKLSKKDDNVRITENHLRWWDLWMDFLRIYRFFCNRWLARNTMQKWRSYWRNQEEAPTYTTSTRSMHRFMSI